MRSLVRRPAFHSDLALAAAAALAFLALYAATWQPSWYGDGVDLLSAATGRVGAPPHPLAPALARGLARLPGLEPLAAVRAAMLLSAAAGLGACFLVARSMGAGRGPALAATALAGAAPGVWFFATTAEVHAVHLAAVALASLAALRLGAAAEGRRALPLFGVCLAGPLVLPSHASGVLLIPGLAGLAWWARRRAGASARAALRPAALVGASVACGRLLADWLSPALFGAQALSQVRLAAHYSALGDAPARVLLEGWLLPLGLLLVLALAEAALRARRDPLLCGVLLLTILPELAFFLWLGWSEHGGYALAVVPAATAGSALLLQRLPPRAALGRALLGIALQVALTWNLAQAWSERGWRVDDRLEAAARALPEGGTLYSLQARAPRLDYYRPDVTEYPLHPLILGALDTGIPPEDFGPRLLELAPAGALAFDLGCLQNVHLSQAGFLPYLESVRRSFEGQPGLRRARAGDWELLAFEHAPHAAAEHGR